MNRFYGFVCLVLLPTLSFAQGKIGYSYDAAGNRVKREIIMAATRAMKSQQVPNQEKQVFSDRLHDHTVKIYPNPTEGVLRISISGLTGTEKCSLTVYTSLGAQIMSKTVQADHVEIDISSHPAGIYLLNIGIDDKVTTWKIVKK